MPKVPEVRLPDGFVEDLKRSLELTGKKAVSLSEVVTALKKWRRRHD